MLHDRDPKGDPFWISIVGLALFVLALVGSCQSYTDCLADGRQRYECSHYARR